MIDFEIPEEALRLGRFEAFKIDGKPVNVRIKGANAASEWMKDHAAQVDLVTRESVLSAKRAAIGEGDTADVQVTNGEVAAARFEALQSALRAYDPQVFTEDVLQGRASVLQQEYVFRMLKRCCCPFEADNSLDLIERERINRAIEGGAMTMLNAIGQTRR